MLIKHLRPKAGGHTSKEASKEVSKASKASSGQLWTTRYPIPNPSSNLNPGANSRIASAGFNAGSRRGNDKSSGDRLYQLSRHRQQQQQQQRQPESLSLAKTSLASHGKSRFPTKFPARLPTSQFPQTNSSQSRLNLRSTQQIMGGEMRITCVAFDSSFASNVNSQSPRAASTSCTTSTPSGSTASQATTGVQSNSGGSSPTMSAGDRRMRIALGAIAGMCLGGAAYSMMDTSPSQNPNPNPNPNSSANEDDNGGDSEDEPKGEAKEEVKGEAKEEAKGEEKRMKMETSSAKPQSFASQDSRSTNGYASAVVTKNWNFYTGKKLEKPHSFKLFAGSGNRALAEEVAQFLDVELGNADLGRFADGEINVKVNENVRGKDVFILQPTSPPVNDNLMELLLMVSCLKRSSVRRVTAVVPYMGYSRADRKIESRVPISARDVATMLETLGVDRVIALDLHSGQSQGFFSNQVPSDNLSGIRVGALYFSEMDNLHKPVVIATRSAGVGRAKEFRDALVQHSPYHENVDLAMVIRPLRKHLGTPDDKQKKAGNSSDVQTEVLWKTSVFPTVKVHGSNHSAASPLRPDQEETGDVDEQEEGSPYSYSYDEITENDILAAKNMNKPDDDERKQGRKEEEKEELEGEQKQESGIKRENSALRAQLAIEHPGASPETTLNPVMETEDALDTSTTSTTATTTTSSPSSSSASSQTPSESLTASASASNSSSSATLSADDGDTEESVANDKTQKILNSLELVGAAEDAVDGRDVILVEDIIDTARSTTRAAKFLKAKGANRVLVFATHGVLSTGSISRIQRAGIDRVVLTNSIPILPAEAHEGLAEEEVLNSKGEPLFTRLSIAPLLAEVVRRVHDKKSVSEVFSLPRGIGEASGNDENGEGGEGGGSSEASASN